MNYICNECMNKPTTMDLVHYVCRLCNKEFISSSIPKPYCCRDCAIKNHICEICGKKIKNIG